MATKKELERLQELANQFAEIKVQAAQYDKQSKALNTEIKTLMKGLKKKSITASNGAVITYSTQTRTTVDEEAMLQVIIENCPKTEAVKTKQYLDMDVLESEIYHGKITKKVLKLLDKCKVVNPVPVLNIKTKKED